MEGEHWTGRRAITIFLACAFAYFFSALLRAVTATLAPEFSRELGLGAAQLGLVAGAFFLGFSIMQIPVGHWLDGLGPKRVLTRLLVLAALGCVTFALAGTLTQLLASRLVIGMGAAACLMAPLTLFRRGFGFTGQLRANSWMLMTGSLGMLASTLPAQWLLPVIGWRGLFVAVAGMLLLSVVVIAVFVPQDRATPAGVPHHSGAGYRVVLRSPIFRRLAPAAFFSYGGLIAMQSLWIGPWLTQVARQSPAEAATGLFIVNASMLVTFLCWGLSMPWLIRHRLNGERLVVLGWPLGIIVLISIIWRGQAAGAIDWALWCVLTSVVTLSQPAVAQALPQSLAGRALSAFNLVIFLGVFSVQWGIGLLVDGLVQRGWMPADAMRAALGVFAVACTLAFVQPMLVTMRARG